MAFDNEKGCFVCDCCGRVISRNQILQLCDACNERLKNLNKIKKATEKDEELVLYSLITAIKDKNSIAIILENYIQKYGPVSNVCGDKIKAYIESLG